jgi:hypothetical protein
MRKPSIAREMRANHHNLDEDSAARLLQGLVHPDDAPPGYGAVAGLLNSAARAPMGPVDDEAAATTVSAMVEVIRDTTPTPEISRRKAMLGKILAGKALAAIAIVGLTASGAAAATGTLPDQAQSVVSDAVSHVGLNIPHPNHGKSAAHRKDGEDHQKGDENEAGDNGQSEDHGKSGLVVEAKDGLTPGEDKIGPAVCAAVSHDQACTKHGSSSESDDHGTPPANPSEGRGKSGEDHPAADEDDHATTPATGSIETGKEHSGRDLPSGEGKPE